MEPLLYIAIAAGTYYLFRKHGNLRFSLKGNAWIVDGFIKILDQEIKTAGDRIIYARCEDVGGNGEECYRMQVNIALRLEEYLSSELTSVNFSRLKIHDLEKTILSRSWRNYDRNNEKLAAMSIISMCFKSIIASYDTRGKSW